MNKRHGPVVIEAEHLGEATMLTPVTAPPVPDDDLPPPTGRAMQAGLAVAARRGSWLGRLFWLSVTGLLGLMISLAAWDFTVTLLARNIWLGRGALILGGIVVFVLVLRAIGELIGFTRLARIDKLQARVAAAHAGDDLGAARRASTEIVSFYKGRAELRWGLAELTARQEEDLDAGALIARTETQLMTPLDGLAEREVQLAVRQVAAVTALVPIALADVGVALFANIRMVRRVAGVYGARAGLLGSLRLMRIVAAHLLATGAVAVGDDMIGSVMGGGALSKLSRRFGEGVVNGALTARVGIAAMEVCRPMPFATRQRPRVTALVKSALAGLFAKS